MTKINLHGILAKEFGDVFNMKIYKAINTVKAIDVNRKNFQKRIFELAREGFHYTIIVDGKKITELEELNTQKEPKEIHLIPLIVGSGFVAGLGAAIISIGSLGAIGAGAALAFAGGFAAFVVGAVALTAISIGLQMLLAPKPEDGPAISATTKALSESFAFSNKANVASQGSPVPVGYGRLKVGSQVIQACMKSFPQNQETTSVMRQNPFVASDGFVKNAEFVTSRSQQDTIS